MLDETGGPNVGPFISLCGGFVTRDSRNGEIYYSGQYKAFSHLSPYISLESKIYPITMEEPYNFDMFRYPKNDREIEGVMIENPDGKKVVVLVNPNDHGLQTQIEINEQLWYVELLADSIATIIIEK